MKAGRRKNQNQKEGKRGVMNSYSGRDRYPNKK